MAIVLPIQVILATLVWWDLGRGTNDQVRGQKNFWRTFVTLNPGIFADGCSMTPSSTDHNQPGLTVIAKGACVSLWSTLHGFPQHMHRG